MKKVPLDRLMERIVRPGIEKHLLPLLMYRGNITLGRAHRMWNFVLAAKEHEATMADATWRLHSNVDYSHLCFPDKAPQHQSLASFISRLKMNPGVMALEPGLEEYLDEYGPRWLFHLTPVSPVSRTSRHLGAGGWRTFDPLIGKPPPDDFSEWAEGKSLSEAAEHYGVSEFIVSRWFRVADVARRHGRIVPLPDGFYEWANGKSANDAIHHYGHSSKVIYRWFKEAGLEPARNIAPPALCYPFLIHDGGRPEHHLLRLVNDAVPQYLNPDARADICQDIVVGILSGDFDKDNLTLPAKEMMRRVARMFPTKYGPLSLDAPLPGTDDYTLMDTLADDQERRWDMA